MKQISKYIVCFVMACASLAWGCDGDEKGTTPDVTNPVTGVELDNLTDGQIELAGENPMTMQVVATPTPTDADDYERYNFDFFSDDPAVFTVDKRGLVTAQGAGEATLTITAKNNSRIKASCRVVVANIPMESFTIDPDYATVSLSTKSNFYLCDHIAYVPANCTAKRLNYSSSNSSVVSVDRSGIVHAAGVGTATVTVTSPDDPEMNQTCSFTVATVMVSRIDLREDIQDYYMMTGASFTVTNGVAETSMAKVFPRNAANKAVDYTSSNTAVATVTSAGAITAKAKGTTTVRISAKDGSGVYTDMSVTVVDFSFEPMSRANWEIMSSTATLVRTTANGFAACGGPELALDDAANTCAGFLKINASYDGVPGPTNAVGIHFIIDRKETTEFNYFNFEHQMSPGNSVPVANYSASGISILGSDDGVTFKLIQYVTLPFTGDGVCNIKLNTSNYQRYIRFTLLAKVANSPANTTSNYVLVKNIGLGMATPIPNE